MAVRRPETRPGTTIGTAQQRETARRRHQLTLKAREELSLEGVTRVESFDEEEVVIETDAGVLLVRGAKLHVTELNLETGSLRIDGVVSLLEYAGDSLGKRGKGFLARLLR